MKDLTQVIHENSIRTIPLVATLGIEVRQAVVTDAEVVAQTYLPDRPEQRNHVGGPHAGAMFTAAESATGAVIQAAFADLFDRMVPLIMNGKIRYQALAKGDVLTTARLSLAEVERTRAELAAGTRPEFFINVEIAASGVTTGILETHWTLKPI